VVTPAVVVVWLVVFVFDVCKSAVGPTAFSFFDVCTFDGPTAAAGA
jgi:hypothetical protein